MRFLIAIIFVFCACVKYVEVKDEREWGNDIFLSSSQGMIISLGIAKSIDSLLCEEKAKVHGMDKMQYLLSKSLMSFMTELEKDTANALDKKKMLHFIHQSEFTAMEKLKLLNLKNNVYNKQYTCEAKWGLALDDVMNAILLSTKADKAFFESIQNFKIYQKMAAERDKAK